MTERDTNPEWFTPEPILRASERVLQVPHFDLDAASCAEANRVVGARRFLTRENCGLAADWRDARTVFCNPPSGVIRDPEEVRRWGTRSYPVAFWRKCNEHFEADKSREIVFLGFNLEILRSAQDDGLRWPTPMDFTFCIPKKRLRFVPGAGQRASSPANASVIICVSASPPTKTRFEMNFTEFGAVLRNYNYTTMVSVGYQEIIQAKPRQL